MLDILVQGRWLDGVKSTSCLATPDLTVFLLPWKTDAGAVGESEGGHLEKGAPQWPVLQAAAAVPSDGSEAGAPPAAATGTANPALCCYAGRSANVNAGF